jgi:hypothetical protein
MNAREVGSLLRTFAVGFILILGFAFVTYEVTAFWIGAAIAVPVGVTYGKWLRYQARL